MNKKLAIVIGIIALLLVIAFGYGVKRAGDEKLNNKKEKIDNENQENNLIKWEIPENEILIDLLEEDTNQDGLKEVLVISEDPIKRKACFYIFNSNGEKVYYKESGLLPDRIESRNFGEDDYNSFFLVFEGQFKEGFFIRWDGKEYEIPGEER